MKRSRDDLIRSWLEKARRDLVTARDKLEAEEPFTDIACFHAQQAAEKHIKAFLLWQNVEFPKTHEIGDLVLLARERDATFERFEETASQLTPYAVEARYPEFDAPPIADARAAVDVAEAIAALVLSRIPEDLRPPVSTV